MLSGCLPLRKNEHANKATHTDLSLHKTQVAELFFRHGDTTVKPKSGGKKKVEKYNEKTIYWDGKQKQKHYG